MPSSRARGDNVSLAQSVLSGERLSLARLLTLVENDTPDGRAALDELFPHTGRAHLIGITGAPGTGKSSLVNQLALCLRKQQKRVAIVAVDPSSPFTGGAVLGDRVRMRDLAGDAGVFIRSMATRGSLGGLAQATAGVVQVFDAAGFDVILIETVGAGQSEVDIARLAHTTLVVEAPGLGDDIQAIKAGILEIADILVINKADRPGVDSTERALKSMLDLAHPVQKVFMHHGTPLSSPHFGVENGGMSAGQGGELWIPPIRRTVATEGAGLPELLVSIQEHAEHLRHTGDWARRERARLSAEFVLLIRHLLVTRFRAEVSETRLDEMLDLIQKRALSPREAATRLVEKS
jgi:LAO/AO transport system kinase